MQQEEEQNKKKNKYNDLDDNNKQPFGNIFMNMSQGDLDADSVSF